MRPKHGTAARIAAGQHGVITRGQLLAAGFDPAAIRRAVAAGRLHRVHRGVYALGHDGLSTAGRFRAATLAGGAEAFLSHEAAANLLSLVAGPPPAPVLTTRTNREVGGVRVHRCRRLHRLDTAVLDGIPTTTVPRTLVDLAGHLALEDLAHAVHRAHVHHRTTPEMVLASLARVPNRPGAARLRQALLGDDLLLSRLEAGFVALLRRAGLPLPRTNVRRAEGRVDCHWPERGLTIELDSYRFHATRTQWEADVRRDRRTRDPGRLRLTWGDVFERPAATLAEVAPLLAAATSARPRR